MPGLQGIGGCLPVGQDPIHRVPHGVGKQRTTVGVYTFFPVEKTASNITVWKYMFSGLDHSLLKVNVYGFGRVVQEVLDLIEGMIVSFCLLIGKKGKGTGINFIRRTSAVTKYSI